ncbi:hypothetical protein SCT_2186 [Sulfuricella sp. T08]|uniref:hypothetical protein n=1 Tax=Sulfuricella sp. T08 TaxID=1632857 RepID=UPI000617A182|nr:hypothetical protein [Sulfuricella sp. T08]GAO36771.1 hypothetical protein SCT_2186 [Sulfuricella sp. T08]
MEEVPFPSDCELTADLLPDVDRYLQEAAAAYHDTPLAEQLLWRALAIDPACLKTYFSLYKFYFYKHRLDDAEHVTLTALETAARQGGFSPDWTVLTPASVDWSCIDAPQHFYLFSLKALAFIRLRRGKTEQSIALLAKLQELDPRDSVGSSVIRDLASVVDTSSATCAH